MTNPTTTEAAQRAARACGYEANRYFDELYFASAEDRAKGQAFTSAEVDPHEIAARLAPIISIYFPAAEISKHCDARASQDELETLKTKVRRFFEIDPAQDVAEWQRVSDELIAMTKALPAPPEIEEQNQDQS